MQIHISLFLRQYQYKNESIGWVMIGSVGLAEIKNIFLRLTQNRIQAVSHIYTRYGLKPRSTTTD